MSIKGIDPLTIPSTSKKRAAVGQLQTSVKKTNIHGNYNVPISNRYENLDEIDDTSDDEQELALQRRPKPIKIPPIIAYNYFENHVKTISELEKRLNEELTLKFKGKRIIILTSNLIDYNYVKGQLDESNIQYTTKTPLNERELKLIIRNLPPNITPVEIEEDLKSKQLPVLKVAQITKKENDKIVHAYPLFMVTFQKGTDIKTVIQHNKICFCIIQWEKIKSKGITQCYRCQSFGHIALNCTKTPRCVKCGQTHRTEICKKPLEATPTCANCGQDHTANYTMCPKRPVFIQKHKNNPRAPTINNTSFPPINKNINPVNTSTPIWPTQRSVNQDNNSTGIADIIMLVKSFIQNFDLINIINKIKNLMSRINAAPDGASKLMLVIDFVVSIFG